MTQRTAHGVVQSLSRFDRVTTNRWEPSDSRAGATQSFGCTSRAQPCTSSGGQHLEEKRLRPPHIVPLLAKPPQPFPSILSRTHAESAPKCLPRRHWWALRLDRPGGPCFRASKWHLPPRFAICDHRCWRQILCRMSRVRKRGRREMGWGWKQSSCHDGWTQNVRHCLNTPNTQVSEKQLFNRVFWTRKRPRPGPFAFVEDALDQLRRLNPTVAVRRKPVSRILTKSQLSSVSMMSPSAEFAGPCLLGTNAMLMGRLRSPF